MTPLVLVAPTRIAIDAYDSPQYSLHEAQPANCAIDKMVSHVQTNTASTEDITPTPSLVGTPVRRLAVLNLVDGAAASHVALQNTSAKEGSAPLDDISARSSDVYDSLLFGRLPRSSSTIAGLKGLTAGSEGDEETSLMPSSGDTGVGRSYDSSRAGSSEEGSRPSALQRSAQQQSTQRRQQGRQIYATPSVPYYSTSPTDNYQTPPIPNPPPQPPTHSQSYTGTHGTPQYPQRSGYAGQYTMSPQPPLPPPPSMFSSQPQYGYSHPIHHPGIHSPETAMPPQFPSMSYSSASLAPPIHGRPMFPYQRYSSDGASTSGSTFSVHTSASPEHGSTSPYDPSPPSGSPHPSQSASPYSPQQASSFPSFNYPTVTASPPLFTHYQGDYPHSTPSMYPSQYAHSYGTPPFVGNPSTDETQRHGGTWYYVPQTASSSGPPSVSYDAPHQFQGMYPVPYPNMNRPELDAYGNPSSASSIAPSHASAPPLFSPSVDVPRVSASSSLSNFAHDNLSSRGRRSPLSAPPHTVEPSVGESGSERGHGRRSHQTHPSVPRSEWVMWVGNVPGDATHDELWRFFTVPPPGQAPQPTPSRTGPHLLPAGLLSPDGSDAHSDSLGSRPNDVASIFLISRSNCAFVNYSSEAALQEGVRRFNGTSLRPGDARLQRLVCRVRGKDDDLRAGVGGQRGMGMHIRWIKEQKEKERARLIASDKGKGRSRESEDEDRSDEPPVTPSESSQATSESLQSRQFSSEDDSGNRSSPLTGRSPKQRGSSSGSYASTNSSFLQSHFPKRYFILKSLNQDDLDLSVQRGLWSTQFHNEAILNQAYRTSSDVYLIFGVNKSGEFFGYARMASPIGKSQERISWASRTDSSHSHSPSTSLSSVTGKGTRLEGAIPEGKEYSPPTKEEKPTPAGKRGFILSPGENRIADDSPQPLTTPEQRNLEAESRTSGSSAEVKQPAEKARPPMASISAAEGQLYSAPAEMHQHHRKFTVPKSNVVPSGTMDPRILREKAPPLQLDPEAPLRAVRDQQKRGPSSEEQIEDEDGVKRKDTASHPPFAETRHHSAPTAAGPDDTGLTLAGGSAKVADGEGEQWGTPFKVQWLRVQRMPFYRTRHIRNPWNHDREVKVSRDGTELEPTTGQALLDEWDKPEPTTTGPSSPMSPVAQRRGGGSRMQSFRGGVGAGSFQGHASQTRPLGDRGEGNRGHQP